jgi:hypothetical protein
MDVISVTKILNVSHNDNKGYATQVFFELTVK